MFSGIVQGYFEVAEVVRKTGLTAFSVKVSKKIVRNLKKGASVSVDGVCLTVTSVKNNLVSFDMMGETFKRTTL